MVLNTNDPGFVKFFYTVENIQHVHTMTIVGFDGGVAPMPGTSPGFIDMLTAVGTTRDLAAGVEDYVDYVFAPSFNPANFTFNYYELWSRPTPADDAVYITTGIDDVVGVATSDNILTAQTTYSFRTTGGGIARVQLMEAIGAPWNINNANDPGLGARESGVFGYVTGNANIFQGRDNSRIIAGVTCRYSYNDALSRRRYGVS